MAYDWSSPGTGLWNAPLWGVGTEPSLPTDPAFVGSGWSDVNTQVPGQANPQFGTIPSYFSNLPPGMSTISPLGMAALMRMFGNVQQGSVMKQYPVGEGTPAVMQGDKEITSAVPAPTKETGWATPEPASAQDFRKMQAGGAWPALQAFMDLAGNAVKEQFMAQMQSMWAPQQKKEAPGWKVPKQR